MDEITLSEAFDILAGYGVEVWAGIFAAIFVFIIEIILCKKGIIFASGDKKIEKAKREGKTLTATMTNCRYNDRAPQGKTANRMYIALYEYYVGSKRMTKQIVSTSVKPPHSITLYYTISPNKAFSEYDVGKNPLKFIIYIVPVVVAFFVMQVLGING